MNFQDTILASIKTIQNTKNFPLFFLDTLHIINKKEFILKTRRKDIKIHIRSKSYDRAVFLEMFILKEYIFPKKCNPKTIIDIGAHAGMFSVLASKNFPEAKIIAIEPDESNCKAFKKNMKLNNIKTYTLEQKAVTDKKEIIEFYISKNNVGHSTIKHEGDEKVRIATTNLKEIITTNKIKTIDILKIDIEGGEYDVIYTLKKSEFRSIKYILLEWHNIDTKKKNWQALKEFIEKKGFSVKKTKNYLYCQNKEYL